MADQDLGKTSSGIQTNLAGLLCYAVGWVSGLVFYLIEKENKFVRFHAFQSMVIFGALTVLQIVIGAMPVFWALMPIVSLAGVALWIFMMIKAYQGEKIKLPVAGDLAEKNS